MFSLYSYDKNLFFGLFAILSTMACTHKSTSSSKVIHNQSKVCGKVTWVAGNQMPSPDRPPRVPKGIQREVLIYELTNLKQVTQVNGFYSNIKQVDYQRFIRQKRRFLLRITRRKVFYNGT
jgi:hypothetical protein